MPSGLRLFVKKRGKRRTGARWPGLATEAVLFVALIGLGAFGLYWLVAHVLLAEEAEHGWWPWLATLIPLALLAYGATSLVFLLWQNVASSERRAAVVQMATDWELLGGDARPDGQARRRSRLPTVPPTDVVTDSPGVRLAYRLPIDAAPGWVSFTMAAVCIVWNTLVAVFVVQIVGQHLAGRPNWLLTWLMVPFVLAGAWTLIALVRHVSRDVAVGTTRMEVSAHPFYPGGRYRGFVSQTGRLRVRWFQVQLVCEEQAVYQQGTDTRRATHQAYRATVFSQRKFNITPPRAYEAEFDVEVPEAAMHSFVAPHNAVLWMLVVRGRIARWGDFERRFPVYVYPRSTASQAPDATASLASTVEGAP